MTVLLPAQDRPAAAVATALDLLGQSLGDLEVLLLAGERHPVSMGMVDDPRIRVVPVGDEGLGRSLNEGLALARGEFVARASPGDRSDPDRLARQVSLLSVTDLAFVGTGWRSVGTDGAIGRVVNPPAGDAALRAALAGGDAIGHPTATMRRDAVDRVGGWRPAFVGSEDYDLLLRLLDRHAGACMPEALVDHRGDGTVPTWRTLEQRIHSELAAMAAHDRRQAGRPDGGDRAAPADRSLLHRMGVADEEITRALLGRALALAVAAGAQGQWRAMREAARLGLNQQGSPASDRSRFTMLWLRSLAHRPAPPSAPPPA